MSDYYRCDYCGATVHVDDDNHGWQDADSDERGVCAKCIKSVPCEYMISGADTDGELTSLAEIIENYSPTKDEVEALGDLDADGQVFLESCDLTVVRFTLEQAAE
jgi:hypothetical protein